MLLAHRHMMEWIHATDGGVDSCYGHIDTWWSEFMLLMVEWIHATGT